MATWSTTAISKKVSPMLSSLYDLTIIEVFNQGTTEARYITFYLEKKEISLAKYNAALEYGLDSELYVYPEVPQDTALTITAGNLDDTLAFLKRPGLSSYESMKGADFVPKRLLEETLIMEQISETPTLT